MIEKTISTGLMQPGETKTLRVDWGKTIPGDYVYGITAADGTHMNYPDFESIEQDADGLTLALNVSVPEWGPMERTLVCRAFVEVN